MSPDKVPVCGEPFLQAWKEMYFPLLGSFSKDSIPPPLLTGGRCLKLCSLVTGYRLN